MLSPIDPSSVPVSKYSKKKVLCKCSCGNPELKNVQWSTFTRNTPTCGQCEIVKWRQSGITKYGRLTLRTDINKIQAMRHMVTWLCDCGNEKEIRFANVVYGNTTTCGCAYSDPNPQGPRIIINKSLEEWKKEFPDLISASSENFSRKSRTLCNFRCSCGQTFENSFGNYRLGKKCGHCNDIKVVRGDVFNGFIYDGDKSSLNPVQNTKDHFLCKKCGRRDLFIIRYIFRNEYARCKHCNSINASGKYGKLRMKHPRMVQKYETKKEIFICDCGNETDVIISNVINGVTKSCGNCRKRVADWYIDNEHILRNIQYPISPTKFPTGGVLPLEDIISGRRPFKALCPSCNGLFFPRLNDIHRGLSLTCGCSSNRISSGQNEIIKLLIGFGIDAYPEYSLNGLKYDICIPNKRILIEYQGLKWHSFEKSKLRDNNKYLNALQNNYEIIFIFEDEWIYKRESISNLLIELIAIDKVDCIPVHRLNVRNINTSDADSFYEKHHYMGPCGSEINYGIYCDQELLFCSSFKSHDNNAYELVRFSTYSKSKSRGFWKMILDEFVINYAPSHIFTYSDNRLSSGSFYEHLGFTFSNNIDPDYYLVVGNRRLRQYELDQTIDLEPEIHYPKIWDFGKKKWILTI